MSDKKILDIIPPELGKKAEKKPLVSVIKTKQLKKWPAAFIASCSAIILVGILSYFFINPKAEIKIWPTMEDVSFSTVKEFSGKIIYFEETLYQEFPSSGIKESKTNAEGVIRVYNNYHLDQVFIAGTRFWCFENKEPWEFRTKEWATIPPKSHLDLKVTASFPGEEYNIPPCTFSVPGLRGSPRYTAVYGESFSPMEGGQIAELPQVTRQDLDEAKEFLTQKAFEESEKALNKMVSSEGYILAYETITQEIIESTTLAEVGQELNAFGYRIWVRSQALVLEKAEIEDAAKVYILSQVPQEKEIQEKSLTVNYSLSSADLKKEKITLNLEITAGVFTGINEADLKEAIRGKSFEQTKQILADFPETDKAHFKLWPFWVNKTPQGAESIIIKSMVGIDD